MPSSGTQTRDTPAGARSLKEFQPGRWRVPRFCFTYGCTAGSAVWSPVLRHFGWPKPVGLVPTPPDPPGF